MDDAFSRTLDTIYDAVTTTGRWGSALSAVAEFVGAPAGLLLFCYGDESVLPLGVLGFDQRRFGDEHWASRIAAANKTLLRRRPLSSLVRVDLPAESDKPELMGLADLARERGLRAALGAALLREEGFLASLWLFHGLPEAFDAEACNRLRKVLNHLERALSVQRRVERAEGTAAAGWQAFDRVVLGAVVVNAGARPLLINRAAKRIAAENDGFAVGNDGLSGISREETEALRAAIADVVHGRAPRGLALSLPRRSAGRPYEVMVVPVRRSSWSFLHERASAIVFISDSTSTASSVAGFVSQLYGLSTAETRLALLLLGGQGLAEAANALGISRNTAHTQLAHIFRKTRTSSQTELVRALLTGPAAVRPPGDSSIGHTPKQ